MKNLSDLFHRHDITKLQFVIACILTFIVGIYIFHAMYTLIGWWILVPLGIAVVMFFFMKGTTPQQKKWVAVAPKKVKIASYLPNDKVHDIVRFEVDSSGKMIYTKKHGYMFYINDLKCDEVFCTEKRSAHIDNQNWTLKQVNISKNDTKDTNN